MDDHHFVLDRKIYKEDEGTAAKQTRSFRYEDYSTRRVFLRSYPLQWDWSPAPDDDGDDEKHGLGAAEAVGKRADGDTDSDERCGVKGWKRQVVEVVVEWGEDKLLLLQKAKKRLALYLLGCHYGHRPVLQFKSGAGSCTAAMLTSR